MSTNIAQFTGVRELPQGGFERDRDWRSGGITGIVWESRIKNGTGMWMNYNVVHELQYGISFDSYNCTGFATLNGCVEIQEKYLTGQDINYSDMFLGAVDGLTEWGNYIAAPPDAIRYYGCLLESEHPWPRLDSSFTREDYLRRPSQEKIDKAKKWLETRDLKYEFIDTDPESIKHHLEQAPLCAISAVCPGWGTADIIQACGMGQGHEYTIMDYVDGQYWLIKDHYDKEIKKLAWNYQFRAILKGVLTIKEPMPILSPDAAKILAERQNKFVLAQPSGRIALVKGQELQEAPKLSDSASADERAAHRAGLMALMGFVILDKGGITDAIYDEIPHRPF